MLTVTIGKYNDPTAKFRSTELLSLTLPYEPYNEAVEKWTGWSNEVGNANYGLRFRIVPEQPFLAGKRAEQATKLAEQETARAKRRAEQWAAWLALDAQAPFSQWIEPFSHASDEPAAAADRIQQLVDGRTAEFAGALQSPDREVVREAVYALSISSKIPAALTHNLLEAGIQVASYAATARDTAAGSAQDDAENMAWDFFLHWTKALEHATPPVDNKRYRELMDKVQESAGRRHSVWPTDLPSRLARQIDKVKDSLR